MMQKAAPSPTLGIFVAGGEHLVVPGHRPCRMGVFDCHKAENQGVVERAGRDAAEILRFDRRVLGIVTADKAAVFLPVDPAFFQGKPSHFERVHEHAGVIPPERLIHTHPCRLNAVPAGDRPVAVLRIGFERLKEIVEMLECKAVFRPVVTFEDVAGAHPGGHIDSIIERLSKERRERAEEMLPGAEAFGSRLMTAAVPA